MIKEVKHKLCCNADTTAEYLQFVTAAIDACWVHLPIVQARRREKRWVDQDVCIARDIVYTARHQHYVLGTCQSKAKLAEARRSLSTVYTKKQEEYYWHLLNKVEVAAIEGIHVDSWSVIKTIRGRKHL